MTRRDSYSRLFDKASRRVTVRRIVTNQPHIDIQNVRARVRGFTPEEIAGGIDIGQRKVLLLAEDIPQAYWPLQKNDRILIDGYTLIFSTRPDDQTHRDGDILLAFDGIATGA